MTSTPIAVAAAVAAGGMLASTGVLQQRAASRRPSEESLSFRLLASLARDRTWLLGLGTGFASYGFQALALAFGPLALVQPIFLCELIFAVPYSVRKHKLRLRAREWAGLLAVPVGLAIGIVAAHPRGGKVLVPLGSWGAAMAGVAVVALLSVGIGRRVGGAVRSSLYACAGGTVMALQSAFLAATVSLMEHRGTGVFLAWQPYLLIVATAFGVLLVESAYQAGPLAASMPVIDAVEPSVAIAIGVTLFSERINLTPLDLAGTAVGLVAFFAGVVLLDTSPVVHALQGRQEAGRRQREAVTAVATHRQGSDGTGSQ